jgi:hypothetical protein
MSNEVGVQAPAKNRSSEFSLAMILLLIAATVGAFWAG